jgi:hypothetical protein
MVISFKQKTLRVGLVGVVVAALGGHILFMDYLSYRRQLRQDYRECVDMEKMSLIRYPYGPRTEMLCPEVIRQYREEFGE